jgi:superfamily II DNA or RNA helicase
MPQLRPYQQNTKDDIYRDWESNRNVLAVLPTGAGKTVLFSNIAHDHSGVVAAVAHRTELVSQISLAFARCGIQHRIIAPQATIKQIINDQRRELGTHFYNCDALTAVVGVDTLISRGDKLMHWCNQVTLWIQDEAHHVLESNKWGRAVELFPNAKGLGVTATPVRADRKGLGRCADGVFDTMVVGPNMRDLIGMGYLTEYRIFAPPSDLDLTAVTVSSSTGDYNKKELTNAVHKSHIMGDVVSHYCKIAKGKLGITFAVDVATATEIAAEFNAAGIPAEVVSAKTPATIRSELINRFRKREILQLVNVDLFGEGFDLPAIEVVSMARPTQSYGLFVQQFGRALRLMDGKDRAIIIDHVGNVMRHGLPDYGKRWSLDRPPARNVRHKNDDVVHVKTCPECTAVFDRVNKVCPYCFHKPEPLSRSAPEYVDGDLHELDLDFIHRRMAEINHIHGAPLIPYNATGIVEASVKKRHHARRDAHLTLRDAIAWWSGHQRALGVPDDEAYRRFYHTFHTDVLTAQTSSASEAQELATRVHNEITRLKELL